MSSLPISIPSSSSFSFCRRRVHDAYAANSKRKLARFPISLPKLPPSSTNLVQQFNDPIQTIVPSNTAIDNTALKLSSTLLFTAATGMLLITNKIQPSEMAQEQRNAATLSKQLHSVSKPSAMERLLALDKAYPSMFEPAAWWPKTKANDYQTKVPAELEVENRKDMEDVYERQRSLALKIKTILAILGPLLTGVAALGSAASVSHGSSWVDIVAAMAGSLATSVNALERAGQVGMVYDMYRKCGGFFKLLQVIIEATHNKEKNDSDKKRPTAHHEMKVAMELGRSVKISLMIDI